MHDSAFNMQVRVPYMYTQHCPFKHTVHVHSRYVTYLIECNQRCSKVYNQGQIQDLMNEGCVLVSEIIEVDSHEDLTINLCILRKT